MPFRLSVFSAYDSFGRRESHRRNRNPVQALETRGSHLPTKPTPCHVHPAEQQRPAARADAGPSGRGRSFPHPRWGLKPRPGARASSVPGAPSGGRRSHRRRFQPAEPPASSSKCGEELPQPPHPRP
ncbi:unnamed protein product [Rangifer tarandus platyrhynchus]|uniref:Uncharacterized protein n=1 Tax=Rangifer tarandus platyrhynchus TaxID=3082113 RepID=A0ABN8Z0N4_RANTA|nr:unnamed protein product [Rangifer tarandus platyrhynchus]